MDIEGAQAARNDVNEGMRHVCQAIASRARDYGIDPLLPELSREVLNEVDPKGAVTELLSHWTAMSDKPIVLMLDEVDTLVGDTLVSLLRQLRVGYMS